jgi:hypothetical protein
LSALLFVSEIIEIWTLEQEIWEVNPLSFFKSENYSSCLFSVEASFILPFSMKQWKTVSHKSKAFVTYGQLNGLLVQAKGIINMICQIHVIKHFSQTHIQNYHKTAKNLQQNYQKLRKLRSLAKQTMSRPAQLDLRRFILIFPVFLHVLIYLYQ